MTTTQTSYTEPIAYARCAFAGNKYYMFSGETASGYTKGLYYLELNTTTHFLGGVWKTESLTFPGAGTGIHLPGFAYTSNKLYVVGGQVDGSATNGIYCYDLTTELWAQVTPSLSFTSVLDTPIVAANSNVYFTDGSGDAFYLNGSTLTGVTSNNVTAVGVTGSSMVYDDYSKRAYIVMGTKAGQNVQYIDTVTNIRYGVSKHIPRFPVWMRGYLQPASALPCGYSQWCGWWQCIHSVYRPELLDRYRVQSV